MFRVPPVTNPDPHALITRRKRYALRVSRGYNPDTNKSGDIIYANTPIISKGSGVGVQYFWEAFPAGSGPGDRWEND